MEWLNPTIEHILHEKYNDAMNRYHSGDLQTVYEAKIYIEEQTARYTLDYHFTYGPSLSIEDLEKLLNKINHRPSKPIKTRRGTFYSGTNYVLI